MGYLGYKPADKPLTSADITDSIITSTKIADGTIANADINSSAAIALSKLSTTGTASASNYLRGDGAWSAVSSDYVLLATTDASSSSSVSFDGYFSSTYKNYKMIYSGVRMGTTNTEFRARLRTSNADITSSIYKNNNLFVQLDNGSNSVGSGYGGWNLDHIKLQRGTNNGANYEGAGEATFYNPLSTAAFKQFKIETQYVWQDLTYHFFQQQFVQCDTTSALSGISFYPVSGNITSGTFKLYGLK